MNKAAGSVGSCLHVEGCSHSLALAPRSGLAGERISVFNSLRNGQAVSQNGCPIYSGGVGRTCEFLPCPTSRPSLSPGDRRPGTGDRAGFARRFGASGRTRGPGLTGERSLPPPVAARAEITVAVLGRGELRDLFIPESKQMHCWLKRCNYFPFAGSSRPGRVS